MPTRALFRRKPNRLPLSTYAEPLAVSLTLAANGRRPVFEAARWTSACIRTLTQVAERRGALIFAYCFMPDHAHFVVQIAGDGSVVDFVKEFKQRTGYAFKRATGRSLWQKSYYDHVLRRDDDLVAACRYVFANPVRAGLVARAEEFVASGSLVWRREVLMEA
jgi:REP element-mobilizing transposase RayT